MRVWHAVTQKQIHAVREQPDWARTMHAMCVHVITANLHDARMSSAHLSYRRSTANSRAGPPNCSSHICSPALCCPVMRIGCRQVLAQLERAHPKGGACRHTLACSNRGPLRCAIQHCCCCRHLTWLLAWYHWLNLQLQQTLLLVAATTWPHPVAAVYLRPALDQQQYSIIAY